MPLLTSVTCSASPPSSRITYKLLLPLREEVKARDLLSGDHCGSAEDFSAKVNCMAPLPSVFETQICDTNSLFSGVITAELTAYATCFPSGDTRTGAMFFTFISDSAVQFVVELCALAMVTESSDRNVNVTKVDMDLVLMRVLLDLGVEESAFGGGCPARSRGNPISSFILGSIKCAVTGSIQRTFRICLFRTSSNANAHRDLPNTLGVTLGQQKPQTLGSRERFISIKPGQQQCELFSSESGCRIRFARNGTK